MKRNLFFCIAASFLFTFAPAFSQPATAPTTAPVEDPATPVVKERGGPGWIKKHESFVKRAEQDDIDLAFMGDSITELWTTRGRGEPVWNKRYANQKAFNFGIGGDRTQHVLWRIDHGELDGLNPKAVILLIGTNNMGPNNVDDIAKGVAACVHAIQDKCPNSKIVLMAIFPRGEKPDDEIRAKVKSVNTQIQKLADGDKVRWLDIGDKLVEPDGTISKDVMYDFLHPTTKGYTIWADALDPVLKEIVVRQRYR